MNRSQQTAASYLFVVLVSLALAPLPADGDGESPPAEPPVAASPSKSSRSSRAKLPALRPRITGAGLRRRRPRPLQIPGVKKLPGPGERSIGATRAAPARTFKHPQASRIEKKPARLQKLLERVGVSLADGGGAGVPGSPCEQCSSEPLGCNAGVDAELAPDDCTDPEGAFADLWEVVLGEPQELRVTLTSTTFDPFVILVDENCQVLASNDDCEPGDLERSCLAMPLRPGRYFILATSFAAGSTGAYRLELECGEPGECTDCTVADLPCEETITGRIEQSDCQANGAFRDVYRVSLAEAGRIELQVSSDEFDTILQVIDSFCLLVGENDDCDLTTLNSCLTVDVEAGDYQVIVTTFDPGEVGSYALEATCRPGFDPCRDCLVGEVSCGEPLETDFPLGSCTAAEGQGLDLYSFTLTEDRGVDIELTSGAIDTFLFVFDSSCEAIGINDDCGVTLDSCLSLDLPAGDYFVGVSSFSPGETGPVRVSVTCTDLSGCIDCVAGNLDCNGMVQDALDDTACVDDGVRRDLWRLEVVDAIHLRLALDADFEGTVSLLDTRCQPLGVLAPCDGEPGTVCAEAALLPPGSYLVEVAAEESASGSYTLSAECMGFLPCRDCLAGTIACGETVQRDSADSPCTIEGPAFIDFFSLTLEEPQEVEITMRSSDFDAFLVVFDSSCGTIDVNDDCPLDLTSDSCLTINLPAGEHFIGATVFDIGAGRYELSVNCRESLTCADCVVGEIGCGIPRAGELATGDCLVDSRFLDIYELNVDETSDVSLELQSTAFDTFLVLFDADCGLIAFNDDCQEGNFDLSCLTGNLPPGLYLAGVTTFDFGEIGPYELSVTSSSCPPPGVQVPGDLDLDGSLGTSDGMRILDWLLATDLPELACSNAAGPGPATFAMADFNGSGEVDISDAISVFYYLFQEGPPHVLGTECMSLTACPNSAACEDGP